MISINKSFKNIYDLKKFNEDIILNDNIVNKYYNIEYINEYDDKINLDLCFNGELKINSYKLKNINGNLDIDKLIITPKLSIRQKREITINLNTTIKILDINIDNIYKIILKGNFLNLTNINFKIIHKYYYNDIIIDISNLNYNKNNSIIINNKSKLNEFFDTKKLFSLDYLINNINKEDAKDDDIINSFYYPNLKYINDANKELIGNFNNDLESENNKEIKEIKLKGTFKKINGKINTLKLSKINDIDIDSNLQIKNLILEKDFNINKNNTILINNLIEKNKYNLNTILLNTYLPINIIYHINGIYYIDIDYIKLINYNSNKLTCSVDVNNKITNRKLTIEELKGIYNEMNIYYEDINIKNYDVKINELHLYECKNFILDNYKENIDKFDIKEIYIHNYKEKYENNFLYFINLIKYFINKDIKFYFNDFQYIFNINTLISNNNKYNNEIIFDNDNYYIFNKEYNKETNLIFKNNKKIIITGDYNYDKTFLIGEIDELEINNLKINLKDCNLNLSNLKINKQIIINGDYLNLKNIFCKYDSNNILILNGKYNNNLNITNAKYFLLNSINNISFQNYKKLDLIFYIDNHPYFLFKQNNSNKLNTLLEFNINDYSIFNNLNLTEILINKSYNDVLIKGNYNKLKNNNDILKISCNCKINYLELNGNFNNININLNDNKNTQITNLKFIGSYNNITYNTKNSNIENIIYEDFKINDNSKLYIYNNTTFLKNINIYALNIICNSNLLLKGDFHNITNITFYIKTNEIINCNIELNGNFCNLIKIDDFINKNISNNSLKKFKNLILNNTEINNKNLLINTNIFENIKFIGNYKNINLNNCNCNIIYENYLGNITINNKNKIIFLNNVSINNIEYLTLNSFNNDLNNISGKLNICSGFIHITNNNSYFNKFLLIFLNHFNNIDKLYLSNININNINLTDTINELIIENCNFKEIPDNLINLKSLYISKCNNINNLPLSLINLETLKLINNKNFDYIDLSIYPNLKNIILNGVKKIDNFNYSNYSSFMISKNYCVCNNYN